MEVYRAAESIPFPRQGSLHTRGGLPRDRSEEGSNRKFSPHAWRYSILPLALVAAVLAFSMDVEVFRIPPLSPDLLRRSLYTRVEVYLAVIKCHQK